MKSAKAWVLMAGLNLYSSAYSRGVVNQDMHLVRLEIQHQSPHRCHQGEDHLFQRGIPGFRILQCSANIIDRVLDLTFFSDKHLGDSSIGSRELFEQRLAGLRF